MKTLLSLNKARRMIHDLHRFHTIPAQQSLVRYDMGFIIFLQVQEAILPRASDFPKDTSQPKIHEEDGPHS